MSEYFAFWPSYHLNCFSLLCARFSLFVRRLNFYLRFILSFYFASFFARCMVFVLVSHQFGIWIFKCTLFSLCSYQSFFGAFTSSIKTVKRFPSGGPNMSLVRFSVDDSIACLTCNDNVVYEKTICFVSWRKRRNNNNNNNNNDDEDDKSALCMWKREKEWQRVNLLFRIIIYMYTR